MTDKKPTLRPHESHADFLAKVKKNEKQSPRTAKTPLSQSQESYAKNFIQLTNLEAFNAILKQENEIVAEAAIDPYSEPRVLHTAGGMSFGEKMAWKAGFLEGAKRVKVLREHIVQTYIKNQEEKKNENEN